VSAFIIQAFRIATKLMTRLCLPRPERPSPREACIARSSDGEYSGSQQGRTIVEYWRKVAEDLAPGSGSAPGEPQIDVARSLERAGIFLEIACGALIGSLLGVLYAAGRIEWLSHRGNDTESRESYMTKIGNSICAGLMVSILIAGLSGCEKKEGPAERAGKEIDKSVKSAGKQIEKAGQRIQDEATGDKK
jgi:hypothetical protein